MSTQQISNQAVKEVSATRKASLGQLAVTPDGRKFRYSQANSSTDLVAGNLQVAANPVANHVNRLIDDTVTAPAVDDKKVTLLSIGATALTADQYRDGYMVVMDNTGEGQLLQIEGHAAYDASATDVVIELSDPVLQAMDSTTEIALEYNAYDLTVISATDQADLPTGITHVDVDVSVARFYWTQTGGPAAVWGDETFASGGALTIGTGVAGQVELLDAAGEPQVGIAQRTGIVGESTLAFLTID